MTSARRRWLAVTTAVLAVLPGTAVAQPVDPTAIADVATPIRVVVAFVSVLLFGGALLVRSEGFVDRSVEATMEHPLKSLGYGALAQGLVAFFGLYGLSQLTAIGVGGSLLTTAGLAVIAVAWLLLAGLGFVVVGSALTDAAGDRQLWPGLAIGAAIGAAVWMLPTVLLALGAWTVVVSMGIGGPARRWFHDSRGVEADTDPDA
jgi:hypothetical protein